MILLCHRSVLLKPDFKIMIAPKIIITFSFAGVFVCIFSILNMAEETVANIFFNVCYKIKLRKIVYLK